VSYKWAIGCQACTVDKGWSCDATAPCSALAQHLSSDSSYAHLLGCDATFSPASDLLSSRESLMSRPDGSLKHLLPTF
jgi:hypothetical protein